MTVQVAVEREEKTGKCFAFPGRNGTVVVFPRFHVDIAQFQDRDRFYLKIHTPAVSMTEHGPDRTLHIVPAVPAFVVVAVAP